MKKLMIVGALICATILAGCSKKSSSEEGSKKSSSAEKSKAQSPKERYKAAMFEMCDDIDEVNRELKKFERQSTDKQLQLADYAEFTVLVASSSTRNLGKRDIERIGGEAMKNMNAKEREAFLAKCRTDPSALKSAGDPSAEIDKLLEEYAAKLRKTGGNAVSESQIRKSVEDLRSTIMKLPEEQRLRTLRLAMP